MNKFLTLLALVALPASSARADIVIDDFSTPQFVSIGLPPPLVDTPASQVSGTGILGGYRDMILTRVAGDTLTYSQAYFASGTNQLVFDNGTGVKAKLAVQYDGDDQATFTTYKTNGLTAFDASQGGNNTGVGFLAKADIGASAATAPTVTFFISTASGTYQSTVALTEGSAGFTNYFVPFTSFVGFDPLTMPVTGVMYEIDATRDFAQDVAFQLVGFTAPAPSGIILGGMAIVIGSGYAWRRRRLMAAA
jgi:hypothetical protein